ncbi:MAG: leucine-rich repeat domain-containing protein [Candidatus Hermodarchaeota archaeon]
MKIYDSVKLEDKEVQAILELDQLVDKPAKIISFQGDIDTALEMFEFDSPMTLWYKNHNIIGLFLFHFNIEKLPESIGNLSHMRFITINRCQIKYFPKMMSKFHKLEYLEFYNNPEFGPLINLDLPDIFQNLNNLRKFQINGLFNVYLPPSFIKLEHLEELDLNHCFFTSNRSSYMKNSKLDVYDFTNEPQFICELPDDLGRIKSLIKIVLSNLEINDIPKSVGNLSHLKDLQLVFRPPGKKINNLKVIWKLKSLESLFLNYCKLKEIPKTIGNLKNLKMLNLAYNDLQNLPVEIKNCQKIEKLCLTWNEFNKELKCLKFLPNLKSIILDKTCQDIIPKELLDNKNIQIKEF